MWEWDCRSPGTSRAPSRGGGEPAAHAGPGAGRGPLCGVRLAPTLAGTLGQLEAVGTGDGLGTPRLRRKSLGRTPLFFNSAFPLRTDSPLYAGTSGAPLSRFRHHYPSGRAGSRGWLSGQAEGAFTPEAL